MCISTEYRPILLVTHALQRCCDSGGSAFHPALVQGSPGCHGAHLLIGRVLQPLQHHLETVAVTRGKAFHHTTDVCLYLVTVELCLTSSSVCLV